MYICITIRNKPLKLNIMTILEQYTGTTTEEIKKVYMATINVMMDMGLTSEEARKIAKETLRETVGLSN